MLGLSALRLGKTHSPGRPLLDRRFGWPNSQGLQPSPSQQSAFEVTAPIPAEFEGSTVNIFFDLFDNQDSTASQAWFSDVTLVSVPEPQTWALLLVGVGGLWWRRRRRS